MIFNESVEDHLSAIENFLADVYDVVVDFDPLGLDEYWIDDGVVTINDTRPKQEQLFVLLHEAGHVILRKDTDFKKMCPGGGSSKVGVLQEEILAWEEARKLGKRLGIELGAEWEIHSRAAIIKYIHWVRT